MNARSRSFAVLLGLGTALSGCAIGPEYVSPLPPIVESKTYLDNGTKVKAPLKVLAGTTSAEPDAEWWRVFHDPVLSRLEARVAEQNLDVQTASLRLRESRAQLGTAAAAALPTVNGASSAYRQQYSQNGIISLDPLERASAAGPTAPRATSPPRASAAPSRATRRASTPPGSSISGAGSGATSRPREATGRRLGRTAALDAGLGAGGARARLRAAARHPGADPHRAGQRQGEPGHPRHRADARQRRPRHRARRGQRGPAGRRHRAPPSRSSSSRRSRPSTPSGCCWPSRR